MLFRDSRIFSVEFSILLGLRQEVTSRVSVGTAFLFQGVEPEEFPIFKSLFVVLSELRGKADTKLRLWVKQTACYSPDIGGGRIQMSKK